MSLSVGRYAATYSGAHQDREPRFRERARWRRGRPDLPDRPISVHPNFVTATGLAQIEAEIARLHDEITAAKGEDQKQTAATAARDLRYWTARRASAEVVAPRAGPDIRFGSTVTIGREDGRRQTFQITGEDEADPTSGTLSYVAPLARALIGKRKGDDVEFMADSILVLTVAPV